MSVEDALKTIASSSSHLVGARATKHTTDDDYVVVAEDPSDLAKTADLALDVYSLARMIASEYGSGSAAELLCLAEATRNEADRRSVSITTLLTTSKYASASGKYSEQAAGKWASTQQDPTAKHVAAAQAAIESHTQLAMGATDYFDPKSQDRGVQGTHKLKRTSEQYIQDNATAGLVWVGPIDGIDAYRLMLFKHGSGTASDALAFVAKARAGAVASVVSGGTVGGLLVLMAGAAAYYFLRRG